MYASSVEALGDVALSYRVELTVPQPLLDAAASVLTLDLQRLSVTIRPHPVSLLKASLMCKEPPTT